MAEVELMHIHQDIEQIKQDIAELKEALLTDEGELTEWAKGRIEEARKTPLSKYVSQEEIERKFL